METGRAKRSAALQLEMECDLQAVRPVVAVIADFLREQNSSAEETRSVELALTEACNNAVKYAGTRGQGRGIGVQVVCGTERIEMHVKDNTPGFAWPDAISLPEPEAETGRGLFLMTSLMDQVGYYRGNGQNWLVMVLQRSSAPREDFFTETERRLDESERIIRDMAEELSFCYESLSAIFRCSADLGKSNDLESFARRLLMDLAQITSAEWFVFRKAVGTNGQLETFACSDPNALLPSLSLSELAESSVEAEAAATREDLWFDRLNPLRPADPLARLCPGAIGLVHPICLGETLIGTLAMAKSLPGTFTAVQANVVHTFADFLAIQVMNSHYTDELVRTRLVSRELEIAKTIQRSLLPKSIPRVSGFGLAGFCESANQVGGDFYDVIKISDDTLLLIIADVMGKGIPAAIFAAILRSLLRAVPEWMSHPGALLQRVNRLLFEELSGVDMFITAQLVYVDSRSGHITTASAGHCPVLLALSRDGQVKTVSPDGMPLGILPETTFANHTEALEKNSRVLLYTDGLTEARNPSGEFFGQERLIRWFRQAGLSRKTAEELKEDLASELASFQATAVIRDDQTFLIMAE